MRLSVFLNPTKEDVEIRKNVEKIAVSLGFTLDDVNPEVVFACGGDGTLLRAVHAYSNHLNKIKFFGANFGNMGFFYDYDKTEVEQALLALKNKELVASKHFLLEGKLYKDSALLEKFNAINEIRIENNSKPLMAKVFINGDLLENYVGTGLVVSSSIGSTAYNLTLSGSAVLNDMESLQLTLVQPSKQCECFKSSIIMRDDSKIVFDLKDYWHEVLLGYDFIVKEHCNFDSIEISLSDTSFTLLNKKGSKPLNRLTKLFD